MIKFIIMQRRIEPSRTARFFIFIAIFAMSLAPFLPNIFAQSEITKEKVEGALDDITSSGTYVYKEADLEEPAWFQALRDWIRSTLKRLDKPVIGDKVTVSGIIGILLLGIVLAGIFVVLYLGWNQT